MSFNELIIRENIWRAWYKFCMGKTSKIAVLEYWLNLEENLNQLYHELKNGEYNHGKYRHFIINDSKRRDIYVADVKDRVVHQILADYLSLVYARHFYRYSCASQIGKGVSLARDYAFKIMRKLQPSGCVWIAQLDVKKYFASISHEILLDILMRRIKDKRILRLCEIIIKSFGENNRGLPLGNLTSQWFGNIYLHELDFKAKQEFKIKYYLRYNDDILILSREQKQIIVFTKKIKEFAENNLALKIPDNKIKLICLPQTADILGICTNGYKFWLRPATKRKAMRKLAKKINNCDKNFLESVCSYNSIGIKSNLSLLNLL